jgi:hypothetical protein
MFCVSDKMIITTKLFCFRIVYKTNIKAYNSEE